MSAALAPPTVGSAPIRAPTPRLKQATVSGPEAGAPAAARRPAHPGQSDPLSDRATSLLIRRTLCPQQLGDQNRDVQVPIEDLLPPLTSRNDVDLQLYAFLAIILREFVQSWYSKITTDESFVGEVLHVVAHCTRALEQRLRKVDLESLVLDEIPDLLDKHITGESILLVIPAFTDSFSLSCSPSTRVSTSRGGRPARGISLPLPPAFPYARSSTR